jgi:hypothetical protein
VEDSAVDDSFFDMAAGSSLSSPGALHRRPAQDAEGISNAGVSEFNKYVHQIGAQLPFSFFENDHVNLAFIGCGSPHPCTAAGGAENGPAARAGENDCLAAVRFQVASSDATSGVGSVEGQTWNILIGSSDSRLHGVDQLLAKQGDEQCCVVLHMLACSCDFFSGALGAGCMGPPAVEVSRRALRNGRAGIC